MRRGADSFLVLECPDFELQALYFKAPGGVDPQAVLLRSLSRKKERVWQCGAEARVSGVVPEMGVAQVLARLPEARLQTRSLSGERDLTRFLLRIARGLSPRVESTTPGLMTIDLSRLAQLPDWEAMVFQPCRKAGLQVRGGLGPTPDLARYAAWLGNPLRVVDHSREWLREIPVEKVVPPALAVRLRGWGVKSLGGWLALPRIEVVERMGVEAARVWDRAPGHTSRALRVEDPSPSYGRSFDFEVPVDGLSGLCLVLRQQLQSLTAALQSRGQAVDSLTLELCPDGAPTHREHCAFPEPLQSMERIWRLLWPRLERLRLSRPVKSLHLQLQPTAPRAQQGDWWGEGVRDPDRLAETLGQLRALLGDDRVGRAEVPEVHAPDRWIMVDFALRPSVSETPTPSSAIGLVLRRFRPALPARVVLENTRPSFLSSASFKGEVVDRSGPWMLSGEWWTGQGWRRREWDVALQEGDLLRLTSNGEDWVVEGIYQ